jgi:hypothetical protein
MLAPKTRQLVREHLRTRRGWYQIHDDDRPARTPPSTLARATSAGPHIGTVCTQIQQHDGVPGVPRIQGVLALAKTHGPGVVEDAAKAALEIAVPTPIASCGSTSNAALAHIGLTRALSLAGDTAGSRKAYQDFFALWKDADADLPVVLETKITRR